METALPLATSVQDAHEKLLDWMQVIEPELRGKEPTGAEAEQQIQVRSTVYLQTKYLVHKFNCKYICFDRQLR